MKKFRFSLEAVQTVRERGTREALEEYARRLHAQTVANSALGQAEAALLAHLEEWRRSMTKGFSPSERLRNEHARTMLEARRNERLHELREASAATQRAQAAFQVARQKSEVVERLHGRQRAAYQFNVLKEEQHFMDELATSRRAAHQFEEGLHHA